MKKIYWPSLVIIVIISALTACNDPETITAHEVEEVIGRFDNGWKNKNPKAVDSVLSEEYIYFTQSGGTYERDKVVQTAGSNEYQLKEMERKQVSIRLAGNTAIVNTTWRGKGIYYGTSFDDLQRCSITLIKRKGKIKILSEHCTPLK